MKFQVFGQTDVGRRREINQDTILLDKELGLFIVADGMGGHRGGEVASELAVETAREIVETQLKQDRRPSTRDIIVQAFREASARIYHKSTKENPELMGMGTTMVLALKDGNRLYFGNVGDSRAYLIRDNNIWQITEDHSLVSEQIRAGIVTEEEEQLAGKNVITRSVGFEHEVDVDILEREMHPGEVVLLCSDGLSGLISDETIMEIYSKNPLEKFVTRCIKAANDAGGDDNISVVVLQVES